MSKYENEPIRQEISENDFGKFMKEHFVTGDDLIKLLNGFLIKCYIPLYSFL